MFRGSGSLHRFPECPLFAQLRSRRADLLGYPRVPEDRKGEGLPEAPRLPERAAIYIAPDGTVHFGALFEGLLPVAAALGGGPDVQRTIPIGGPPRLLVSLPRGSDTPSE